MSLSARHVKVYHVFLASPGDVSIERQYVRKFFEDYNRHTAHIWKVRFDIIDWENYSTIGIGRPQELITGQTLEKYRDSLALVVGIMGQRFGSPTGKAESGTEEEFNWAMESHNKHGYPEIKWFFRKADKLEMPADPEEALKAIEQWKNVLAFRKRMQDLNDPVFYTEYAGSAGFRDLFDRDLTLWLSDSSRHWVAEHAATSPAAVRLSGADGLPDFDPQPYRDALLKRFDKLNFEMLDTTGAYYSGVRLWSVFVPQSVRECHEYYPQLLELPKEHVQRLLKKRDVDAAQLADAEKMEDVRRREYFSQPLRSVLEVVDDVGQVSKPVTPGRTALESRPTGSAQRLVILGDPGSGKSSLLRFLALRWARIEDAKLRDAQTLPLLIDLGNYNRWECKGKKGFIRFLDEAPIWYHWDRATLDRLFRQPDRVVLLLDGLDEIFDLKTREDVVNDIHRFTGEYPRVRIIVTSRVVGYKPQGLRNAEFCHFMLQDLDSDQIDYFLDRWHDETFEDKPDAERKRERLAKAIKDSKPIAMLAGNPLLVTMMAILNRHQELPRDRAELYSQAARVLLHQWDTERALEDYPELRGEVDLRAKTAILRSVAYTMQNGPQGLAGNIIDGETLTSLIEDYLHDELRFEQSRAAAATVVRQLRERNFILCFLGADSYAFVHRTFLEYFCAADFVHHFNIEKALDIDGLIALFDYHCRDDDWREVLRLICGQIDEQFAGRIVEHLATRTDLENWNGYTALPELPLAIWCLSELRNKTKATAIAESVWDASVKAICNATITSLRTDSDRWLFEIVSAIRQSEIHVAIRPKWRERAVYAVKEMRHTMYVWPHFLEAAGAHREELIELATSNDVMEMRWHAIEALCQGWTDEITRKLLAERVVQDENEYPRSAALKALAEKWPDEITRKLLAERAVQDENEYPRSAALKALAEKWPDEITRKLLAERAVQDENEFPRRAALKALAEKWPDEITRKLLAERVVQDENEDPRGAALEALAEKWPDGITRKLLAERAVQDENEFPRRAALQALAEKWPDETTRKLLAERARVDSVAASLLGRQHSKFGHIVLTRDLDGVGPYLDPRKPISRAHIERAAMKAGVTTDRIDEMVRSLSEHLGWDITRGLGWWARLRTTANKGTGVSF